MIRSKTLECSATRFFSSNLSSLLLNLVDAFSGVEVIEEQLRIRKNYQEICSIMNVGMTYCLLRNFEVECNGPFQRRELLLRKFEEKRTPLSSGDLLKPFT